MGIPTITVKTEEEMIEQIKTLLKNGYFVGISRDVNVFNAEKDCTYSILFTEMRR